MDAVLEAGEGARGPSNSLDAGIVDQEVRANPFVDRYKRALLSSPGVIPFSYRLCERCGEAWLEARDAQRYYC